MRTLVLYAALAAGFGPGLAGCDRAPGDVGGGSARHGGAPALPMRVAGDVLVRDARFGLLQVDEAGVETFVPQDELPAVDGTTFGWALQVDTDRPALRWRERLRLPQAPADWGDAATDPDVAIAADGRSVVARGIDPVDDGTLSRFYWALAPGDPAGDYVLEVEVEGELVARFRFRVPAPVEESALLVRAPIPEGAAGGRERWRSVAWR